MKTIRPISDLRNNFSEISNQVHNNDSVIFLTKNGYGDMVVMSVEHYNKYFAKKELINQLTEEDLININGSGYKDFEQAKKEIWNKIDTK